MFVKDGLSHKEFVTLMENLSKAWAKPDANLAVECFSEDAIYMQPPNIQFYQGRDQLLKYFGALTKGYYLHYHGIWFDEDKQTGSLEFSFGRHADQEADTGVCIVELKDGKIAFWREYFQKGPADFDRFLSVEGKEWLWHIGNYP